MTDRKHLKTRVRARMARTGERYAAARARIAGAQRAHPETVPEPDAVRVGLDAGTTALVALLAHAGQPLSPPLALVVAGGIGMGVFQFHYEKEDVATFFLAGRHRWDDDRGYLVDALGRLALEPRTAETSGARLARRHLAEALGDDGPVVAWVDAATLGTRGYPVRFEGGVYHLVVVESLAEDGTVMIHDLADAAIRVDGDRFLAARGRIAKDRHRLLWLPRRRGGDATGAAADSDVAPALIAGLEATVRGLRQPRNRAFGLDALLDWRDRLRGDRKDGWARVFRPGEPLLDALTSVASGIRTSGTDGTLHRRTFAAGLREAARLLDVPALEPVAHAYDDLADGWSALAAAALPDEVPAFRRTAALIDERHRRYRAEGAHAHERLVETWAEADAIRAEVEDCWPLESTQTRALLDRLATLVAGLHEGEVAALDALEVARPRSA